MCGLVKVLHAGAGSEDPAAALAEVPLGAGGLTPAQLSLFAYIGFLTCLRGSVASEHASAELWPVYNPDGTLRPLRADTLKKRVWDLRRALAPFTSTGDPKDALPNAVNQSYAVQGVTCDWTELADAITAAEATGPGAPAWASAVETVLAVVRPPGLLTAPTTRRSFYWVDHYEPVVHDTARRVTTILAAHADHLTHQGRPGEALNVLAAARQASPAYMRPVATATVTALLGAGDTAAAEAEVAA